MRRDLIIAFGFVLSAHVALAVMPEFFKRPKQVQRVDETPTIKIELPPPPPPEEPENQDVTPQETPQMAPPQLTDIPTQVPVGALTTQIEPPPPNKLTSAKVVLPTHTFDVNANKIFDISELDQTPVPVLQIPPEYPFDLKKDGVSGEVDVGFVCDSQGRVKNPYVMKSSNHGFDDAAVRAVAQWRFKPGRKGGRPVNTRMWVPVSFTLQN